MNLLSLYILHIPLLACQLHQSTKNLITSGSSKCFLHLISKIKSKKIFHLDQTFQCTENEWYVCTMYPGALKKPSTGFILIGIY